MLRIVVYDEDRGVCVRHCFRSRQDPIKTACLGVQVQYVFLRTVPQSLDSELRDSMQADGRGRTPKFTVIDIVHAVSFGASDGIAHGRDEIDRRPVIVPVAGDLMPQLISIVEDDQFFRESMVRLMRSLGYAVEAFGSAHDFLSSPRFAETACLITDVNMPTTTGLELYKHLVDNGHAIPTILITGYPNEVDRARALKDGVVCYLPKPFDENHFAQCVRTALQTRDTPGQSS